MPNTLNNTFQDFPLRVYPSLPLIMDYTNIRISDEEDEIKEEDQEEEKEDNEEEKKKEEEDEKEEEEKKEDENEGTEAKD